MDSVKDVLKSMMGEVNLHPNVQNELLRCAELGKSFPYIPKSMTISKTDLSEIPVSPIVKLPSRPMQRPKSTIDKLGIYERDQFRPTPSKSKFGMYCYYLGFHALFSCLELKNLKLMRRLEFQRRLERHENLYLQ